MTDCKGGGEGRILVLGMPRMDVGDVVANVALLPLPAGIPG